jgi:hypothetical protein
MWGMHMSPEDTALCQAAIELAQSGLKQQAYHQFCKNDTTERISAC